MRPPLNVVKYPVGRMLGLQKAGMEPGPLSLAAMFGVPAVVVYTFLARPLRFAREHFNWQAQSETLYALYQPLDRAEQTVRPAQVAPLP